MITFIDVPLDPSGSTFLEAYASGVVALPIYAGIVDTDECAFFGVNFSGDTQRSCRSIWTKAQRNAISRALIQAQQSLEMVLRYKVGRQWVTDEDQEYVSPVVADWGYIVAAGVVATSDIELGSIVDYSVEPAVVGPIITSVAQSELHAYIAGTDIEVLPSQVVQGVGTITLYFPRCRLVHPDYYDNPEVGWDYADVATWGAPTLDIKRVYNDTTVNATLDTITNTSCPLCEFGVGSACLTVKKKRQGVFLASKATWNGSAWVSSNGTCACKTVGMKLNYLSGFPLDMSHAQMIVRLAHTYLPKEPCGCDTIHALWKRDTAVSEALNSERVSCPFGLSDGAWFAWCQARMYRIIHMRAS